MASQRAGDEAAIRAQIDALVEAIGLMDVERVASIYAPDIVSFDVQPPLQIVGAEAKSRNWADAFSAFQPPVDYETRDLSVSLDGDVGFAHSLNRLSGTLKNGQRGGFWVRVTSCWRRTEGGWLIAHDHASVPVDPKTGRPMLDLEP